MQGLQKGWMGGFGGGVVSTRAERRLVGDEGAWVWDSRAREGWKMSTICRLVAWGATTPSTYLSLLSALLETSLSSGDGEVQIHKARKDDILP